MPKKRAVMFLGWVGRNAAIILAGLLLVVIGLAIWNAALYSQLRGTRSQLSGIEIARIVEARAADRNEVTQCRTSLPFIKSFQTLTESVRANLRQQAAANERIAKTENDPTIVRTRERLAEQARMRADNLIDLPNRTKKFCNDLEKRLRAALVAKYGSKLRQLEREEGVARRSDGT